MGSRRLFDMQEPEPANRLRAARVTIKEVAVAAGVSPSTVSHSFSGRRSISPETRERVLAAAEELGYSADPHARSMRTGRSNMIGLVLRPRYAATGKMEASETFNRLAGSMATECLRRGLGLVHVPDLIQSDHAGVPMDGCIIGHPYARDPMIDLLETRGIPIVCADPDPERTHLSWTAAVDYEKGMREVLKTIPVTAGESVWLMPGSEDNSWNRYAHSTFVAWCSEQGVQPQTHILNEGTTPAEAEQQIAQLLTLEDPPAAIVFSLSKLSQSVIKALSDSGLSVPKDVKIAALTDSLEARTADPAVTALDLNHESLAAAAVELMVAQLDGCAAPGQAVVIEPSLHERSSTAC